MIDSGGLIVIELMGGGSSLLLMHHLWSKKSQQESDNACSIRPMSSVSMKCIVRMQGNKKDIDFMHDSY